MSETRTIEVPAELYDELTSLGEFAGLSTEEAAYQAIRFYLIDRSGQRAELDQAIQEATASADAAGPDDRIEGEIVSAWLRSWGTEDRPDLREFARQWRKDRRAA